MAFPLNILTELMIDGVWTDVSGDVLNREAIRIQHGRADEGGRADVSSASLVLNNREGKYSPRNPRSPLFGKIGRNTPVRVSVFGGESYLELDGNPANNVSTPDHVSMHPTTTLDLRAEVTIDWRKEGGNQTLIGKWDEAGNQRSYVLRVTHDTAANVHNLTLSWTTDGTFAAQRQAWIQIGNPLPRYAVRTRMDLATGNIVFYTARSLTGPWTERATVATGSAETIFDSTAPLRIGVFESQSTPDRIPFDGYGHRFEAWVNGSLVASPDFRGIVPGSTSFSDSKGRTWTLNGSASVSNRHTRFEGEIAAWPARWEPGGKDVWVPITAAGIRRRLGQGAKALDSTLRRRIPSGNPLAYWPLEEGDGATQAFSPVPGVKPLKPIGAEFAADSTLGGSNPLPQFTGTTGQFTAEVPNTSRTGWHVEMPFLLESLPSSEREFFRLRLTNAGTVGAGPNPGVVAIVVRISTAGIKIAALNDDGTELAFFTHTTAQAITDFAGRWNRLQVFTAQDGATTYLNLRWIDIQNQGYWHARTSMSGSPGKVTAVVCNSGPAVPAVSFGHLGVFDTQGTVAAGGAIGTTLPGTSIYNNADDGFINEYVATRMERICREEGIPYKISGMDGVFNMGPQRPRPLLELLDSAADVDGGMIYDSREGRAIEYRSRGTQYNQLPAMVLDYASGREVAPPLEPTDDDQSLRNDVTRTRPGGASYRAVLEEGELSMQAPPLGVGTYEESTEVNVYQDDDLRDVAGWALHLGTWNESRYPVVNMRLHGAPQLVDSWLSVALLDRLDILNPPAWLPPGPIRLTVQGYEESLSLTTWDAMLNCAPYGPWQVAVTDEYADSRADSEGSELADTMLQPSTTAANVLTTNGALWTGDLSDYPFDVNVGGEIMTVAGPGTVRNNNSLLINDLSGWTASAGASIAEDTSVVFTEYGAKRSIKVTPDGVSASGGVVRTASSSGGSVVPGSLYNMSAWVYSPGGWSDLRVCVDWYDSSGAFLSTGLGVGTAVPAGQWTHLKQTLTAPASADRSRVRVRHGGTPSASAVYYVWNVQLTTFGRLSNASFMYDSFGRTASSGWGKADTDQAWTLSGGSSADYSVSGGRGRITLSAVNSSRRILTPEPHADSEVICAMGVTQVATGADLVASITARTIDASNLYMARLNFTTGGTVTFTIRKRLSGSDTTLGSLTLPGTYAANDMYWVRFKLEGDRLRGKAWSTAADEPRSWQIDVTDSEFPDAGDVGFRAISVSGNTNASPVVLHDDFEVVNCQRFTVIRGVGGAVLALPEGADVRLANPTVLSY